MMEALPSMKKRSSINSPVPAAFNWLPHAVKIAVLGIDQVIHCVIYAHVVTARLPPDDYAGIDLGNEIPSCIPPRSKSSYSSDPSQPYIIGVGFRQTQPGKNPPFSPALEAEAKAKASPAHRKRQ